MIDLSLLVAVALQASTTTPPPAVPAAPPCTAAEYRQLDFWVGDWIAEWERAGVKGTGRNRITKDEYGQCVITERFSNEDGSFRGFSISTYFAPARQWRQTWMDNQAGYFDLFGGPKQDPDSHFALEQYRRGEASPWLRMIWQDVKPDSFTWRWQSKPSADAPWTDQWVIKYRRMKGTG